LLATGVNAGDIIEANESGAHCAPFVNLRIVGNQRVVDSPQFCGIDLLPYLEAIRPPAAGDPLAGAVAGAVAGVVALGALNGTNQLRLLQITRIDTVVLGLFLDVGH
jgi:hypothetical protein